MSIGLTAIDTSSFPVTVKDDELKSYLNNIFNELKDNRNKIIGSKTLYNLINNN